MPVTGTVYRQVSYMAWANDVMLRNARQLSEGELNAPRTALFGSIAGTIDHVLVVAEMFLAHLSGKANPHRMRRREASLSFAEVAPRLRQMDARYVDLVRQYSIGDLQTKVQFSFVDGGVGVMTKEDIFLHLVNHATYHRGFVHTLLFPLIDRTEASDLTVFLRDVWPQENANHCEGGML